MLREKANNRKCVISQIITSARDFLSLKGLSSFFDSRYSIFPGFCDVHVHLREPGFFYKESISTGTKASARGGFTAVCSMPNLNPVPDTLENLQKQLEIIEKDSVISVNPYASITKGQKGEELADMHKMSPFVAGFTDDGKGVQSTEMMIKAMETAKSLNKIIVAHCEDNSLLNGGYIHDGEYAKKHGHNGICSKSEWAQVERDIDLVKRTNCKYHVCHVSTKESVELIRKAKRNGIDITCETAPHYLVLDENNLMEDGRFKMNPPLRSSDDKQALLEGIQDGTVDMIATDHAPHSMEEKSKGLKSSAFGVVGIETAFSVCFTHLVKKKVITLEKLIDLLCFNPRERFNIPLKDLDFNVFDLEQEYVVNPNEFVSKGKSTPFENERLQGVNMLTVYNGQIVYKKQ